MAKHVLKDAVITVNGVNISDHTSSVEVIDEAEEIDFTSFSTAGYREFGQGLKDATITATVFNDYAASSIDATLEPLYTNGSTFTVTVKPTSAATSGSNPIYTMTARLFGYSPITGSIGEANTVDLTFRNAGTAGLTRGTA